MPKIASAPSAPSVLPAVMRSEAIKPSSLGSENDKSGAQTMLTVLTQIPPFFLRSRPCRPGWILVCHRLLIRRVNQRERDAAMFAID